MPHNELGRMLFARGRRLFSIASIVTIVVAILHAIGNTAPF
jgi:hypothetical protein